MEPKEDRAGVLESTVGAGPAVLYPPAGEEVRK